MPLSDYFRSPISLQNAQSFRPLVARDQLSVVDTAVAALAETPSSGGHANFGHLTLLVFEAVLEVVCVSFPGYIVARQGLFDAEAQKLVANLNVTLFTPCLIFTKLASQLTAEKLVDLAIIPFIFVVQTAISYSCAVVIAKCLRFRKREQNFVIAMAVFGNSNSLPISLVISLSQTLKGLHWDKIPNDNDNEVGARGILYLLIFQQLGQLVRWSWGYNVLLAPPEKYSVADGGTAPLITIEDGQGRYHDDPYAVEDFEDDGVYSPYRDESVDDADDLSTRVAESPTSGIKTPRTPYDRSITSTRSPSRSRDGSRSQSPRQAPELMSMPAKGMIAPRHTTSFPRFSEGVPKRTHDETMGGLRGSFNKMRNAFDNAVAWALGCVKSTCWHAFSCLPHSVQKGLSKLWSALTRFFLGVWAFMNPPLWAMLVAILVASVPQLQHLFYDEGTFISNSVTRAVAQSGGVAVPLILVVLGANLARNTLPKNQEADINDATEERKLLIASLVSRMLLPMIIMAPLLALMAKFIPVSIVDDKIFIIVCFLLTGAPTALQLAQICQVNNVYMSVMSKILFQSYVVWILPSTLILVLLALETVEWAEA